jgi:predicted Zn-dependent protease
MQPNDPNALFAAAQHALAAGQHAEAHRLLDQLDRSLGEQPDLAHLRALILKGEKRHTEAGKAFAVAARLRPGDAQILTNWGNLLGELGDHDGAIAQYDRAIAANPSHVDARINRALALSQAGLCKDALFALDAVVADHPDLAKAHSARGSVLFALGMPHEAGKAYDRALTFEPERALALAGRARIALETGESDAVDRHMLALQQNPGNRDLVLGVVQAMFESGDPKGLDILQDVLRQQPDWLEGHHQLALLRSENGEGDAFVAHLHEAIGRYPTAAPLYQQLAATLASADRHGEALEALRAGEHACGSQADWAFEIARLEGECGDREAAWRTLAPMPDTNLARHVRGRLALRMSQPDRAASILEPLVERAPDHVPGWAYLSLAWRLLGDDRHEWLTMQSSLWSTANLDVDETEITKLADILRKVHKARAHPVGQSLRGGTQTRGRLFWRREPELANLAARIENAVWAHMNSLPPRDDRHPLLRHRDDGVRLGGSWSVRLTDRGFHIAHVHPLGLLSSACYIVVPSATDDDPRAGWLEIGAAPIELGIDLPPLATIEPKPGRLALFPSYLFHGTRPFPAGERLTVAFDAVLAT